MNNVEQIEYKKDFMKISFETDDDLPLGNIIMDQIVICLFIVQKLLNLKQNILKL